MREEMDLIKGYRRLGSFSPDCFHFPPTEEWPANWVTGATTRKLSSFRGFYLCLAVKSQPRAVTLRAMPP